MELFVVRVAIESRYYPQTASADVRLDAAVVVEFPVESTQKYVPPLRRASTAHEVIVPTAACPAEQLTVELRCFTLVIIAPRVPVPDGAKTVPEVLHVPRVGTDPVVTP